jgi:flagellar basal body-associated protein FliL
MSVVLPINFMGGQKMSSTMIILLIVFAVLVFGGLGFFIYMNVSLQKMESAEKEANKNKK